MRESPVAALREARKAFGGITALAGVSLAIMPGTFSALIGPNGCGKTTLFNVMSGYLLLDSGQLSIGDKPVHRALPALLARAGVGRTFQEGRLWNAMSVIENVMIGMRGKNGRSYWRSREPAPQERVAALRLIDEVGLSAERAEYPVDALPLVEKRRVELARALAIAPSLMLVDEIAAGLNLPESRALFQRLGETRRTNPRLAIIAIEHKIDLLLEFSDRVVFMDEGNIVLDTPAVQVRSDPSMLTRYWSPLRPSRQIANAN